MANVETKGVIIKQNDYGEGHRMLSIFTEKYGIIKAVNYNAKRMRSKAASSQFLSYGAFSLYRSSGDIMTVKNIETADTFQPISENIRKLALSSYMADITYGLLGAENPDERIMRIFLNALYALAYRDEHPDKVKTVYELKLMSAGGYMPMLGGCAVCGSGDISHFDIDKGAVFCSGCKSTQSVRISPGAYRAMRYITMCEDKRMLAFKANSVLVDELNRISERYVAAHLDRGFKSLEYYRAISDM